MAVVVQCRSGCAQLKRSVIWIACGWEEEKGEMFWIGKSDLHVNMNCLKNNNRWIQTNRRGSSQLRVEAFSLCLFLSSWRPTNELKEVTHENNTEARLLLAGERIIISGMKTVFMAHSALFLFSPLKIKHFSLFSRYCVSPIGRRVADDLNHILSLMPNKSWLRRWRKLRKFNFLIKLRLN